MTGLWRDAIPLGVAGALAAALVQDSQRLTIGVLGSATGVLCALVMRSLRWRSSEIFFRLRELKHDRRPTVVG